MILATVRMAIAPRKREEALQILKAVAAQGNLYSGCLGCRIYEDVQDDNVLLYEERWRTLEDLERHLRSRDYYKVLLVMEMALKQPEVSFDNISWSSGIETVERARGLSVGERSQESRDGTLLSQIEGGKAK